VAAGAAAARVRDTAAAGARDPAMAGGGQLSAPDSPGIGRLAGAGADLRGLLGVELLPALAVAVLALLARRPRTRLERAGVVFVDAWLVTGIVLLSLLPGLKLRYAEVLAPPVAAALGAGVAALVGRARLSGLVTATLLGVLLLAPTVRALRVVSSAASDSGHLGSLTPAQTARLAGFLDPRTSNRRYEVASATVAKAAALIARDGRRVLFLETSAGHPITPLKRLRAAVRHGQVRYVLIAGRCGPHGDRLPGGCGLAARWARVHGQDVSKQAGLPPRTLYAVAHPRLSARRYPRS
jgi:hypothetical protein